MSQSPAPLSQKEIAESRETTGTIHAEVVPDGWTVRRRVVAIIGAGFSGTMAAIHLRHALPADPVVYLFDKTGRFARGPAYATSTAPQCAA
jgi:threonine dehydrogenase-like Zn-dependent dehydrogenase